MTRIRVAFAALFCAAFLAVPAGTAAAHDYGSSETTYCTITVAGVPDVDGASVSVYYGEDDLVTDDTFSAKNGKTIKVRAEVGSFRGPWFYYEVNCDGTLDVTDRFCTLTVSGIPEGGSIYIKGLGTVANDDVLNVPDGAYYKFVASVGDLNGEWDWGKFDCEATDDLLSFADSFCELTVSGIPEDCDLADIEIEDGAADLVNGSTFWAPEGAWIKYRATVQGITGPWNCVKVDCDDDEEVNELDTSRKWVEVTWILKWTDEGSTSFRDAEDLTVNNGDTYCFPKGAKVYARPSIDPEADWDRNEFYHDSTVYWKLISVVVEDDGCEKNDN